MSDPWGQPAPQTDWPSQPQQNADASGWGAPPPVAQQAPASQYVPPSADEMFGAPSVPSFSFDAPIGTELGGVITELPDAVHKRDFETKDLLYWPDGRPKYTWPVHCQTGQNDPTIQDDDGVRSHFLEFRKLDAVKKAVRAAGGEKLEVGGELYVKYVGGGSKDRTSQYSGSKAKVYEARYRTAAQRSSGAPAPAPSAPVRADPWEGLNPAAVAELQGHGLQPHQVLPHIKHRDGWQGAPAGQILSVVPRPQPVQSDEPPF